MMLNPIIKGWGNYYKYGASGEIFHRMDWEIFKKNMAMGKTQTSAEMQRMGKG